MNEAVEPIVEAGEQPARSSGGGPRPEYDPDRMAALPPSPDLGRRRPNQPDFLAVLDVTEDSGRYGRLATTLPVHEAIPHGAVFSRRQAVGMTYA